EDVDITKRLKEAGTLLGIRILDHIIIGNQGYVSLREKGLL
ncbi:MAG: DNA repair protein RadC, partial [Firmicutes bacterium]|nr:DNA repair protein RadC [Bacillota bacterium]